MTMKSLLAATGIAVLMLSVGCSEGTSPVSPSHSAINDLGTDSGSAAYDTYDAYGYPVVTFESDGTARPATVTVPEGGKVLMVNNTARYVLVRSTYCSQFSSVGLQPGASIHTRPFYPSGKTCPYWVWQNYPQKTHEGVVNVQ